MNICAKDFHKCQVKIDGKPQERWGVNPKCRCNSLIAVILF